MEAFDWVSMGSITKFNRAVKVLKDQNNALKAQSKPEVEITEEAIKALYLKYGGLVVGDPSTQLGVDEGVVSFAVLSEEEKVIASEPKKKGKK